MVYVSQVRLFVLFVLILALSGCSGMGPKSVNMIPKISPSSSKIPGDVLVADITGGFADHSFMTAGHFVKQIDYKDALIKSLAEANIFDSVSPEVGKDYRFDTQVQDQLSFPGRGLSAINCLSSKYSLFSESEQKEVWSTVITSRSRHGLLGMGLEYVNALENNTKKNIDLMIKRLRASTISREKNVSKEGVLVASGRSKNLNNYTSENFDPEAYLDGMSKLADGEDIFFWKDSSVKLSAFQNIFINPIGTRLLGSEEIPSEDLQKLFNDIFRSYMVAGQTNENKNSLQIRGEFLLFGSGDRLARWVSAGLSGSTKVIAAYEVFLPNSEKPVAVVYNYAPFHSGVLGGDDDAVVKATMRNLAMNISALLTELLMDENPLEQ